MMMIRFRDLMDALENISTILKRRYNRKCPMIYNLYGEWILRDFYITKFRLEDDTGNLCRFGDYNEGDENYIGKVNIVADIDVGTLLYINAYKGFKVSFPVYTQFYYKDLEYLLNITFSHPHYEDINKPLEEFHTILETMHWSDDDLKDYVYGKDRNISIKPSVSYLVDDYPFIKMVTCNSNNPPETMDEAIQVMNNLQNFAESNDISIFFTSYILKYFKKGEVEIDETL